MKFFGNTSPTSEMLSRRKLIASELAKYTSLRRDFQEKFKMARSSFASLRKAADSRTTRVEWYSDPYYELNPLYFMGGLSLDRVRGRYYNREPSSKLSTLRYDFDENSKLLRSTKFAGSIEFWIHNRNVIQTLKFGRNKRPSLMQKLLFQASRPVAYISYDGQVMTIIGFKYQGRKIHEILYASDNAVGSGDEMWTYSAKEINHDQAEFLLHAAEFDSGAASNEALVDKNQKKLTTPVWDLRDERLPISSLLESALTGIGSSPLFPNQSESISAIALEFNFEPPSIWVNFDTRPTHSNDGIWSHHSSQSMTLPRAEAFLERCVVERRSGWIIDMNGRRHRFNVEERSESITRCLKSALANMLLEFNRSKEFTRLRRVPNFQLVAQSYDPYFYWNRRAVT